MARTLRSLLWLAVVAVSSSAPRAQVTTRVSVSTLGVQGNGGSRGPAISADGRFVAFTSAANNLVPSDVSASLDVFLRDRRLGVTTRMSVSSAGVGGDLSSFNPSISADGRFVAFTSWATNLVAGEVGFDYDVFVHDRTTGATARVSEAPNGAQGNDDSGPLGLAISGDGRWVAFASEASNLVFGDDNDAADVFLHDRQSGATIRVTDGGGGHWYGGSGYPSLSADGRHVVFTSAARDLVPGDSNGAADVFVHDRTSGETTRVSVDSGGTEGNGVSLNGPAALSADGRFVAFHSDASNLADGDTNQAVDVFLHDRWTGSTRLVSVDSSGRPGNDDSDWAAISPDGRFVAFGSLASNLAPGDTNGFRDVFLHDRESGVTTHISRNAYQADGPCGDPRVSDGGRFVAFSGEASHLVPGDTNYVVDVFVHDRSGLELTSLCWPGADEVIVCPCSNPPADIGRGCDNSSGTGGAVLSASGSTYLSAESLVFTTSGQTPGALSFVLQGTISLSHGAVFGQGVRCAGGELLRLYTKPASGGGITAPDADEFDLSVSARSAELGRPIRAGQSRTYFVSYRDPIVLGGCPATSTFNATQSGRVSWWP